MVLSLGPVEDVANDLIEEFMRMLKSNGMLDYRLAPPFKNSTHIAPGEKVDLVRNHLTELMANPMPLEEGEIMDPKSEWQTETPPQHGIVVFMIDHYNATLMVPTKWEYRNE